MNPRFRVARHIRQGARLIARELVPLDDRSRLAGDASRFSLLERERRKLVRGGGYFEKGVGSEDHYNSMKHVPGSSIPFVSPWLQMASVGDVARALSPCTRYTEP